nr:hypothetical protein [Tanacetum cinerariifolium]
SDCFQITSWVSNGVARKSTQARSRGTVEVHKFGEENQEVEFDLTSSEDDS